FDETQFFDEIAPLRRADDAEGADAVAYGYLVGGLFLVFGPDEVVAADAHARQLLFHPAEGEGQGWSFALQFAGEGCHEGAAQYRFGPCHVGDGQDEVARLVLDGSGHPFRPVDRQVIVDEVQRYFARYPAEVFDDGETEHDGYGPELAQGEDGTGLVGFDKAAESFCVYAAVAVGDDFEDDVVYPRHARGQGFR